VDALAPYAMLAPGVAASAQALAPAAQVSAPPPTDPVYERNKAYLAPGDHTYNTPLPPEQEAQFRQWVAAHGVPFDPAAATTDYDMRGFWRALQSQDPRAVSAVDPNDQRLHYPDYWKTPYHESFSAESQWANPATAPSWNEKDQLVTPEGVVIYDDRAPKPAEQ